MYYILGIRYPRQAFQTKYFAVSAATSRNVKRDQPSFLYDELHGSGAGEQQS
jgi:hypothetical protein